MEGIFCHKRRNRLGNMLGLAAGLFLPALFGFLLITEPNADPADTAAALFFSVFGLLVALLCGVSLYVNRKAFVRADQEGVSGYFHFGLAMQCRFDEIEAVSFGGVGLTLQLKNKKKYSMLYLDNALELGSFIKNRLPLPPLSHQTRDQLRQNFQTASRRRRHCALGMTGCFVLIFAGIFLTVWLTEGKEMRDFGSADWQTFNAMVVWDLVLAAVLTVLIRRFLRHCETCQQNLEELHLLILKTTPLPAGNARKVYLAMADHPPIRVTVCGLPRSAEVYYIVEELADDEALEKIHESKIYPSFEALLPELDGLTEVPL